MNRRTRTRCPQWPQRRIPAWIGLFGVVLLAGCTSRQVVIESGPQAYYQTGFPIHDTSDDLERVRRSVKRIHFTSEYRTYLFAADAGVMGADRLTDPGVLAAAVDTLRETESKGGTATILARARERAMLITNQHVVHHPAVTVRYFEDPPTASGRRVPPAERRVASVSVRTRQHGALADHPRLGAFEVLASDSIEDLALLEIRFQETTDMAGFVPLTAPVGDPMRLGWGSFVYVFGYPHGYAMVTFGIISDPNRDRRGGFLTNGLWNEGISGGPVLALRGETGRLEWVGIARAGAGTTEIRLEPRVDDRARDVELPYRYEGPLFVGSMLRIHYGITFSVPMTRVRAFIARHRGMLASRGYDVRAY